MSMVKLLVPIHVSAPDQPVTTCLSHLRLNCLEKLTCLPIPCSRTDQVQYNQQGIRFQNLHTAHVACC